MADGADRDLGQLAEALVEQAQHRALAGAGIPGDQSEAPFLDKTLFDTPVKVFDPGRDIQRLGRQFR